MTDESARKRRDQNGVVISLSDLDDGWSRLVVDDVIADDALAERPVWRHKQFFTDNTYPNDKLDLMELSDEEYTQLGVALIARLLAVTGRVKE